MNGIQLKQMRGYTHTQFEEEETSSNGSVLAEEPVFGDVSDGNSYARSGSWIAFRSGVSQNFFSRRCQEQWKTRTLLEKVLLVLSTLLLLLVVVLFSTVCVLRGEQSDRRTEPDSGKESPYCLTPACVTVASSLINSMDFSAHPCDNFYQYSCGGWIKSNPIPEGKSIWGTFGKLWQENQVTMKNVLERPMNETASEAERKAQIYYFSCMDTNETIEALGAQPMLDLLKLVGGWNISGNFSINEWDFQRTLQIIHNQYNVGGLFTWAVTEDDKDSARHIVQVDQGGLTLPAREYYLNKTDDDEVLSAYLKYMTTVGVLLGGEETSTRQQMRGVIDIEKRIAEITIPFDQRRDENKNYHKMNVSDLQIIAPMINWTSYFTSAFSIIRKEIRSSEEILVSAPGFMSNLTDILEDLMSTNSGKIALNNYLIWQMVNALKTCLSKPFRDASKLLQRVLLGSDGGEEPWRYCVTDTNSAIGFALGAMFVRETFHGESKPLAEKMINDVRTAFENALPKLNWMDDLTRELAKEKANAITSMIGFPDYILSPDQLDEKYKELNFTEYEYFENNIRVNQFSLKKNLEKLYKPVNKTRWGMPPATVNAYYTPTKNQIVFPAGILQAPFYDSNFPRSLNFGAMGVVMGHELTHAFDDQGRLYDKTGNLHAWWNEETVEKFNRRTQCVVEQYSNFSINGEHINGNQTLGENIADNGGLKAAFHAYEDWISSNREELPLPGLNVTHQQLFFIGFAQVWCSASTKEALHLQLLNDPHCPPMYRVVGPLSNSIEFSKTFNCPAGSFMNPVNKCEVW